MSSNYSCFINLYGEEYGALRYLFSSKLSNVEQDSYDDWMNTLENISKCPVHKEMKRTCVCLEQTCPQRGLICFFCLMDSHKAHAQKVFKIEEIACFLQENQKGLRENEDDKGKILQEVLENDPFPTLLEEFFLKLSSQYADFMEKMQGKNAEEEVKLYCSQGVFKNAEKGLSQRLDLIGSLVVYNEDSSLKGIMKLEESKAQLVKKMDFFKEYLIKEMEAFEDKLKGAIDVTLNLETDIDIEKYQEEIDKNNQKPESKDEEEEKEEDIISSIQREPRKSWSIQQNIIRRLPHLPSRAESYWPVTFYKKERIKFTPLRERVQLLGFTQLKIVHFDNQIAKFMITLYESEIEPQDQDLKMTRIASSKDKKQEETIYTQEIQIKPEENEESNFILFDFPALLKEDHEYILELTAVENFGCTCKYGLNNSQEDLQSQSDNDVLKFLPVHDEFELLRVKSFGEFVTNETQGLFPSLIYDIILKNPSKFDFPLC